MQMLRQLSFVSGDTSVVGSYHTVSLGQFYKQSVVESLVNQMERVRHGGVALVHGQFCFSWPTSSVVDEGLLNLDTSQVARGAASFKAFRLSPGYLAARKAGRFHAQRYTYIFISNSVV